MEQQTQNFRRKMLSACVASILTEAGFDTSDKVPLETLAEVLQSGK